MDSQNKAISAEILIEVEGTVMHRFVQRQKSLFTSGTCKVAKIQNPNHSMVYFINLNSFYYTLSKSLPFIRIEYDDTISYLFPHFDNGLSSLTLLKNSPRIHNFQEILRNAASLAQYDEAIQMPQIKAKVDEHCPNVKDQAIYCADNIKKTIKTAGKFLNEAFKTIGGYLSVGIEKAGNYIQKKIQGSDQKEPVHPETKEKWQKIKKGTNDFFTVSGEYAGKILNPVYEKGKQWTQQLSNKIDQSENQNIKYAKQLAGVSGQAINEAFVGLAEGGTEVGKEFTNQSKKIVNKKYGEDYVKTFIEGEGEKNLEEKQEKTEEKKEQKVQQQTPQVQTDRSSQQLYPKLNE